MGLKLMCIVAHPDDECFAFGGALALSSEQGAETYVVCMTDGKAATHRGNASSAEDLGTIRRREFAASCRTLGVTHDEVLHYEDGQLEVVLFSEAAGILVERMRRFQPDVVLTFGGDGAVNTHPDHTMVSLLATAAFHWAGRPKRYPASGEAYQAKRLYYLSTNFFLPDRQPPLPTPWTVTLDIDSVRQKKTEAFRQHTSQAPLMESTKSLFDRYGAQEFYALAASPELHPAQSSNDLFDGLTT